MRLRLYHHRDGARIAYRELGSGQALALLHSTLLSHMEWEPASKALSERYRVVLPDLPLHGDSEARPRHPYTIDWFSDVFSGFCREVLGPHPIVGGHGFGAEILLHAIEQRKLEPKALLLMPSRLHAPPQRSGVRGAWRLVARCGALPGLDRLLTHAVKGVFTPELGMRLSARGAPSSRDLMRHAFADVPGNRDLARSWARFSRSWPAGAMTELLELYPSLSMRVLLLWADNDLLHPLSIAEEALALLPNAQLRVLEGTGFLIAHDDPVGVAREISAFCG